MTVQLSSREIRRLVTRTFLELGAASASLFQMQESSSAKEGGARVYRTDALRAVWMVHRGVIRFEDADGNVLRTINLLEKMIPQAIAA